MKAVAQRMFWPVCMALTVASGVSVWMAVQRALIGCQDFQWSGAHMFAQRIDPYADYLAGDPRHAVLMSQVPNYLHEYYVALWPIGLMSFGHAKVLWTGLNLLFAVTIVLLLRSVYGLSGKQAYLLAMLLATSTPFRIAVGSGQQALLETLLVCVALWKPSQSGTMLGMSYFKYSFSPIFFFYAAACRAWKQIAISLGLAAGGLLIFWARVHGSLLKVLAEPFMVSRWGMEHRTDGDLISLTNMVYPRGYNAAIVLALALSAGFAFIAHRRSTTFAGAIAALAAINLALLPHATHDAVLLSVPSAWLMANARWSLAIIAGGVSISMFWFGFKLVPLRHYPVTSQLLHMGLLAVLFVVVLSGDRSSEEFNASLQGAPHTTAVC
jgi:hypothetical protein